MSARAMKKAKVVKVVKKGRKGLKWEYDGYDKGWHVRVGACYIEIYADPDGAFTYMQDNNCDGIMFWSGSVARAKKRVEVVVAAILEGKE